MSDDLARIAEDAAFQLGLSQHSDSNIYRLADDWLADNGPVMATALTEANATIARLEAEMKVLRKRLTPRPIRYAPKDGRLLIGVERPPMEEQTFFYDIVWNEQRQQFVTPFVHALNGATHFLDPRDMIGIVWPHEVAKQRRAALTPGKGEGE